MVSKDISTLIGAKKVVTSTLTVLITLDTTFHDPLSRRCDVGQGRKAFGQMNPKQEQFGQEPFF